MAVTGTKVVLKVQYKQTKSRLKFKLDLKTVIDIFLQQSGFERANSIFSPVSKPDFLKKN